MKKQMNGVKFSNTSKEEIERKLGLYRQEFEAIKHKHERNAQARRQNLGNLIRLAEERIAVLKREQERESQRQMLRPRRWWDAPIASPVSTLASTNPEPPAIAKTIGAGHRFVEPRAPQKRRQEQRFSRQWTREDEEAYERYLKSHPISPSKRGW